MTGNRRISLLLGLVAVLLATGIWLDVVRERRYTLPVSDDTSLYMTERAVKRVVVTYRPLAADLYWIRAIQYYGGTLREIKRQSALGSPPTVPAHPALDYHLLYPLLDLTTTLDPRFNIAYRFGAIFLSEPYPTGAGRPDQAVTLLEKGLRLMPDKWEYLEDIGFIHYWDLHDFRAAARYFNQAADVPGAPWWLRSLAATTLAKGGQRSASRLLWRQMYESATDERAREAAHLKLLQLDALDEIEQLQALVDRYAKSGPRPASWEPLVRAGLLRQIPVDPSGTPYDLSASGTAELSKRSPLFPLPIEPAPLAPES